MKVRINKKIILEEDEIIYLDHYDRKTYIHTANKIFCTYQTAKEVANKLSENFILVNKALYINILWVSELEGCKYVLKNGEILYGAVRKAGFHRRLNKKLKGIIFIKR